MAEGTKAIAESAQQDTNTTVSYQDLLQMIKQQSNRIQQLEQLLKKQNEPGFNPKPEVSGNMPDILSAKTQHLNEEEELLKARNKGSENEAKLKEFRKKGSKLVPGGSKEVSDMISLVAEYESVLQQAHKEFMESFNRAKNNLQRCWLEFQEFCDSSTTSLPSLMCTVDQRKDSDDRENLKHSISGAASGAITVASLATPVTWPVAAVGIAAGGYSAYGNIVQNIDSVEWQTNVKTTVEQVVNKFCQLMDKLIKSIDEVAECFCKFLEELLMKDDIPRKLIEAADPYQVNKRKVHMVNQVAKVVTLPIPAVSAYTKAPFLQGTSGIANRLVKTAGAGLAVYSFGADIYQIYSTMKGLDNKHELHSKIQQLIDEIKEKKYFLQVFLRALDRA